MNPRRKPTLEIRYVGEEVLVHDVENAKVHILNVTAGDILTRCDGTQSVAALASALAEATGIDVEIIEADVRAIVATFSDLQMIVDA